MLLLVSILEMASACAQGLTSHNVSVMILCIAGTTIPSAFAEGVPAAKEDKDGNTHSVTKELAASQPQRANAPEDGPQQPEAPQLPEVAEVLDTMRKRLEALNGPDMPRI